MIHNMSLREKYPRKAKNNPLLVYSQRRVYRKKASVPITQETVPITAVKNILKPTTVYSAINKDVFYGKFEISCAETTTVEETKHNMNSKQSPAVHPKKCVECVLGKPQMALLSKHKSSAKSDRVKEKKNMTSKVKQKSNVKISVRMDENISGRIKSGTCQVSQKLRRNVNQNSKKEPKLKKNASTMARRMSTRQQTTFHEDIPSSDNIGEFSSSSIKTVQVVQILSSDQNRKSKIKQSFNSNKSEQFEKSKKRKQSEKSNKSKQSEKSFNSNKYEQSENFNKSKQSEKSFNSNKSELNKSKSTATQEEKAPIYQSSNQEEHTIRRKRLDVDNYELTKIEMKEPNNKIELKSRKLVQLPLTKWLRNRSFKNDDSVVEKCIGTKKGIDEEQMENLNLIPKKGSDSNSEENNNQNQSIFSFLDNNNEVLARNESSEPKIKKRKYKGKNKNKSIVCQTQSAMIEMKAISETCFEHSPVQNNSQNINCNSIVGEINDMDNNSLLNTVHTAVSIMVDDISRGNFLEDENDEPLQKNLEKLQTEHQRDTLEQALLAVASQVALETTNSELLAKKSKKRKIKQEENTKRVVRYASRYRMPLQTKDEIHNNGEKTEIRKNSDKTETESLVFNDANNVESSQDMQTCSEQTQMSVMDKEINGLKKSYKKRVKPKQVKAKDDNSGLLRCQHAHENPQITNQDQPTTVSTSINVDDNNAPQMIESIDTIESSACVVSVTDRILVTNKESSNISDTSEQKVPNCTENLTCGIVLQNVDNENNEMPVISKTIRLMSVFNEEITDETKSLEISSNGVEHDQKMEGSVTLEMFVDENDLTQEQECPDHDEYTKDILLQGIDDGKEENIEKYSMEFNANIKVEPKDQEELISKIKKEPEFTDYTEILTVSYNSEHYTIDKDFSSDESCASFKFIEDPLEPTIYNFDIKMEVKSEPRIPIMEVETGEEEDDPLAIPKNTNILNLDEMD